jgi:hypothetical protein
MQLNKEILHSNLLARAFLVMYKEDGNKMNNNLEDMLNFLSDKLRYYSKQKINLEEEAKNAYDTFIKFVDKEDVVVDALPFIFRLILRNPKSNKKLLKLAREENKKASNSTNT